MPYLEAFWGDYLLRQRLENRCYWLFRAPAIPEDESFQIFQQVTDRRDAIAESILRSREDTITNFYMPDN